MRFGLRRNLSWITVFRRPTPVRVRETLPRFRKESRGFAVYGVHLIGVRQQPKRV